MEMIATVPQPAEGIKMDVPSLKTITISKSAAEAFKEFLKKNKDYLQQSAGVFHTDNHSNW